MKYAAGDIDYWVATRADEPAVRDILARISTGGQIRLSFQREPDALAGGFGAKSQQFIIARNRRTGDHVGVCERVVRDCFVNGEVRRLPYLAALRVVPEYRHRLGVVRGGFEAMRRLLGEEGDLTWSLTSIMSDNRVAQRLLGANLRGMPRYEYVANLSTFVFTAHGDAELERATVSDWPALSSLLLDAGARHQFTPAWTQAALRATGLAARDFFVLRRGGLIVACVALWDVSSQRQLVVSGYSPWLGRGRPLVNLVGRLLDLPRLPPPGERLRAAYLSHLAVDEGSVGDLTSLVAAVRGEAHRRGIGLVFMGHPSDDGFAALLRRQPRQREFPARLYTVRWPDGDLPQLDPRLRIAPELALL